tara:strand:+ start:2410 stop:2580 length:171 start_codon:yes stop_codon:yes gene_type:complete
LGGERQSKITVSDLVLIDGAFFLALLAWFLFYALCLLACSHVFAYSLFSFGNYWRV